MAAKKSFVVEHSLDPFYQGEGRIVPVLGTNFLLVTCRAKLYIRDAGSLLSVACIDPEAVEQADSEEDPQEKVAAVFGFSDTIVKANSAGLVEVYKFFLNGTKPELLRSFKINSNVPASVMSYMDGILAIGFTDGLVRLYDLDGGFCTATLKGQHSGVITSLLFLSGSRLLSAAEDGLIVEWNLKLKGRAVKSIAQHTSAVTCLCQVGDYIASGSRDGTIGFFAAASLECVQTLPVLEAVEGIAPLDGNMIAFAGDKGIVRTASPLDGVCQVASRKLAGKGHQIRQLIPTSPLTSPTSALLAVTSDCNVFALDRNLSAQTAFVGNLGEVTDAQVLPDGQVAVSSGDCELKIFAAPGSLACKVLSGHSEAIVSLAVSQQTGLIVTGSRDSTVRVWSPSNGYLEAVHICQGHTDVVSAVAVVDVDRTHALIASGSSDLTIKLWQYDSTSDRVSALWTVKAHDKDINSLCFASSSLLLSASQDKSAKLWDVAKGSFLATLQGHKRGLWTIACSGDTIATGSADRTIKLWSLSSRQCLKTLEGHTNSVLRVVFPEHGLVNHLLSVGSDGLLKVWDCVHGDCLATFDEHADRIWALCVFSTPSSPDAHIITGDSAGSIKFWRDCTTELEEKTAAEMAEMHRKEQELSNLIRSKDYSRSLSMTIAMDQPGRSLSVLTGVLADRGFEAALATVQEVLQPLDYDAIERLIRWVRDWNTNFKRSLPANLLLQAVLSRHSLADLSANVKSFGSLANEIAPYHEKHIRRLTDMSINSYTIDLVLRQMSS